MTGDSLLVYPCDFPVKIVGRAEGGLARVVLEIVARHAPDFDAGTMAVKPSREGRYLSVTCVIRATSRAQLDALYRDLCDHPGVVMAL